jgi:hypothetical protein
VALAAAYPIGLISLLGPVVVRKLLDRLDDAIWRYLPAMRTLAERGWVRRGAAALTMAAVAVIVWTIVAGQARLSVGRTVRFRSTGLLRPLAVLVAASVVARRHRAASVLIIAMPLLWLMPHDAYRDILHRIGDERHPLRDAAECVRRVQTALPADARHGLYVDGDGSMWHPINYYFRRVQPWTHQPDSSAERLARYVNEPDDYRPSLVQETRYRVYAPALRTDADGKASVSPPMIGFQEYVLLLPGPYRVCSPESRLRSRH